MISYLVHLVTLAGILASAAIALQLLVGATGLLSVAQAVFLAIGSYTAALLTIHWRFSGLSELTVAVLLSALSSLLISFPSLRLRDDYFAIVTFGLQLIATSILYNWASVTNGPLGIGNIPPLSMGGFIVDSTGKFLATVVVLFAATFWIAVRIANSRFGLTLRAVKSDELFAQSLGKNTLRMKMSIVFVSAVLTAVSGVLYAHFLTYIDPSSFTIMDSILLLSMVIIGGQNSPIGTALGTLLLVALPEALRFLGLPSSLASDLRQILYGVLLVAVVSFRPHGLLLRRPPIFERSR